MLRGMAGSVVGIWVAHGEGRCLFPDEAVEARVLENDLAPLRYTDPHGRVTQMYPHNPNGSPHGIAALCSGDGRHLAMMPHPERCDRSLNLCAGRTLSSSGLAFEGSCSCKSGSYLASNHARVRADATWAGNSLGAPKMCQ